MPSNAEFEAARKRAEDVIRTTWKKVAHTYTLGWGGPIESVERDFPFVRESVSSIRHQISPNLPVLFFQSRESAPKDMIVAIPFWKDTGNPFNCRLASARNLSLEERGLYNNFAQAFWFAIDQKMLPNPRDAARFQAAILAWTGRELFAT
jgi:hypothetical protein